MKIELRESFEEGKYRLIIYMDNDQIQSGGFKVTRNDLYELYILLKDIFKDL